jgi:hypothetical protein
VPPDGRPELIVHVGTPYEEQDADGGWQTQPKLLFAGQLTRPLVLRSRGEVSVLGDALHAGGSLAFVGGRLSSCTDRRLALAELHGDAEAGEFGEALARAGALAGVDAAASARRARCQRLRGPTRSHATAVVATLPSSAASPCFRRARAGCRWRS